MPDIHWERRKALKAEKSSKKQFSSKWLLLNNGLCFRIPFHTYVQCAKDCCDAALSLCLSTINTSTNNNGVIVKRGAKCSTGARWWTRTYRERLASVGRGCIYVFPFVILQLPLCVKCEESVSQGIGSHHLQAISPQPKQ